MRVCAPQAKNFQTLFCNFVYFKSIGGKICIILTNWGKNMHLPLFLFPFNNLFSPTYFLSIFLPRQVKQKNIHPCPTHVLPAKKITVGKYRVYGNRAQQGSIILLLPPPPDGWGKKSAKGKKIEVYKEREGKKGKKGREKGKKGIKTETKYKKQGGKKEVKNQLKN